MVLPTQLAEYSSLTYLTERTCFIITEITVNGTGDNSTVLSKQSEVQHFLAVFPVQVVRFLMQCKLMENEPKANMTTSVQNEDKTQTGLI